MAEDIEALITEIRSAFAAVPRGLMTLHEAEVLDNYGGAAERERARRLDVEEDWTCVSDTAIATCSAALNHLDPQSFCYYLPAYMIWALRHFPVSQSLTCDSTIYALDASMSNGELREHKLARFRLLDRSQAAAVCHFLRHMARQEEHVDADAARAAFDTFWNQFE